MEHWEIVPRGPFSLPAAAGFGFGPTEGRPPPFDGVLRYAFAVDGGGSAGVELRRPRDDGPLSVELHGDGDPAAARRQLERVLSLDHDGDAFLAIGERDTVMAELQRAHPGQRPVLFFSPYEAAAWSVISARMRGVQAAEVRRRLAERLGRTFTLAGRAETAFPEPARLLSADRLDVRGLSEVKQTRLRAVAEAACDGRLDVERLKQLGPVAAHADLQSLPGIGPFYAGLIVLRATGFADAMLPMPEPKVLAHVARFYGLEAPPGLERLTEMAEAWRPFRTWATVLIRLAGDRAAGGSHPRGHA